MYIKKVDEERYEVKVNTNLGEQLKIVHKSQLEWYFNNQLMLNL